MTNFQKERGRVDVRRLKFRDPEWGFYWDAYIGDERINGGVCTDLESGYKAGGMAITHARKTAWFEQNLWDVETGKWLDKKTRQPAVSYGREMDPHP